MSDPSPPVKTWFLIYTKPRQEQTAQTQLTRQGYRVYLPMIEQHRRRGGKRIHVIEPLFPRYLFIHLDTCTDDWGPIRSTIGVSLLVRFGQAPASAPDALIDLLRARESASGLHVVSGPDFKSGQPVRVSYGVMQGYEGIFVAANGRERVLVLLDILGRKVRASVDPDQLQAAE
jgi:transcriptional antiterminator RfaH